MSEKMAQCPRCIGRGFLIEGSPSNRGTYARTCPRCRGWGQIKEKRLRKSERPVEVVQ